MRRTRSLVLVLAVAAAAAAVGGAASASAQAIACPATTAERLLGIFLERPSGKLPRKWVVLPRLAEFMKFSSHHGFRIKPAV